MLEISIKCHSVLKEFHLEIQLELPSGVVLVKRCGYLMWNTYVNPLKTWDQNHLFRGTGMIKVVDEHAAEDGIEVFSTKPGLDWIFARNFLTCLQKLSSYTFGHLEVSELAACLEKASFSCTSGHVKVFQNLLLIYHP
ncbi:hypothetical protein Tco_0356917 [Tanacetum coccineum]